MSASASSRAPEAPSALRRRIEAALAPMVPARHEARFIAEDALAAGGGDPIAYALELARRRAAGEPLQHVLGHWGFRRLDVLTDRRALVPRPETETLVSVALSALARVEGERFPLLGADLGTGSGVIACCLASESVRPVVVHATDLSEPALALAAENVARCLEVSSQGRVVVHRGSWFDALPSDLEGELDLVVSNPPYLAEAEWRELDAVVRDYDPPAALIAGPTGLECLEQLVVGGRQWLRPGGAIALECAPHQAPELLRLAGAVGYHSPAVARDLAGRDRILLAWR
ncbi:MAG TPA: HemK/PrmC family methyltransferase [Acidimicrobiales bacterium]|nr:HemK/PrmC family methyltransferase [Acidimicrobiales bacterium]